jgi:hypothetical protein
VVRTLLCVAIVAAYPGVSPGEQVVSGTETVIRLTVQPMAAPKPALRYLLLPDLTELQPGNPIQSYLLCMLDQPDLFEGDAVVRRDRLLAMPLKDLPVRELADYGGGTLRIADRAARMDKPDWQILLKLRADGINTILPDVQQMRQLASALQVRFRTEVAQRRYDAAIRTARTMFALSRHMGEHPTLIGDLVAIAIAFVTIAPLEEMLEQPGCPNLYWALTNLPSPMISLARGMEAERLMIQTELVDLSATTPMTAEQLQRLMAKIDMVRAFEPDLRKKYKSGRAYLDARLEEKDALVATRRRLVQAGIPEDRLRGFPADQVLLLDEKREYEMYRDEFMKLVNLPAWEAERMVSKIRPPKDRVLLVPLVPATAKVRRAQTRLEQRIALLRDVEALRLYAAEHDGQLPEKLADSPVPLPVDPVSGKPFRYKVEGTTAHILGSPPPGEEKNPAYNLHYEITIRK